MSGRRKPYKSSRGNGCDWVHGPTIVGQFANAAVVAEYLNDAYAAGVASERARVRAKAKKAGR
ncbi:MAG TPA: hypothetical protein VHM19_15220 [Polyangiales bacterium]|nr:hypothetical protein [Polyangiales bacterium]